MLEIRDLHVSVAGEKILKGVTLTVREGELHTIMGPNGSGKSTLANVIVGRPEYQVDSGEILYLGKDLLSMPPDQRAREGIFLAFQYPVELPGVRNRQFLKAALDATREHRGESALSAREFDKIYKDKVAEIGIDPDLAKRSVNEGFSGGEKKRNEMLQMSLINPRLAVLDETDSGLDIDALKSVADGINRRRSSDNSIVLVTHYQRILNYVIPDYVHVLVDGTVVKSGGRDLAVELESKGYSWIRESVV